MNNTNRIRVLQALRLKGRVESEPLAAGAGLTVPDCTAIVDDLTAEGFVEEARGRFRLTAAGRDELTAELSRERQAIDQAALTQQYHAFDEHNTALKTLMSRWQLKDEDTPNDHTDAAYDQAVVEDLVAVDTAFRPLLKTLVDIAPRLAHYPDRFTAALDKVRGGDHSWFAKPLADSYHTVWFELHEELLGLAGRTRAGEAESGSAD